MTPKILLEKAGDVNSEAFFYLQNTLSSMLSRVLVSAIILSNPGGRKITYRCKVNLTEYLSGPERCWSLGQLLKTYLGGTMDCRSEEKVNERLH